MARRSFSQDQSSQIDPFNAGEPILPWDDPEAMHDDCRLPDDDAKGYEAPQRTSTSREKKTAQQQKPRAKQPATSKVPSKKSSTRQPAAPSAPASAQRRQPAAPSAPRNHGEKRKTSKIERGIGIWIAIIILIQLCGSIISCAGDLIDDVSSSFFEPEPSYENDFSYDELDLDEQAVVDAACSRMDTLADDPAMRELAISGLTQRLENNLGYSPEQLGLDTEAYADHFFQNLSYEVLSAYTWSDGTGSITLSVDAPDPYAISSEFYARTSDFRDAEGLYGSGTAVLSAERQEQMRGFFDQALSSAALNEDDWFYVDLHQENGAWVMDEDDLTEQMSYLAAYYEE